MTSDAKMPMRHVALRMLRLLRRGRNGVEADIREEDHARAAEDAAPAELAERRLSFAGMNGCQ